MAPQLTYTMFPARCSCYDGIVSSESCVFHGHLDIGSETAGSGVVESAQSRGDTVTITVERTSLFVVSLGARLLTSPLPLAETKIGASASVRFSARKIHFFFPRPALAKIASTCCLLRPLPVHTTGTCDRLQKGSKPYPDPALPPSFSFPGLPPAAFSCAQHITGNKRTKTHCH